ncbi:hypothetical protein ACSQ67_001917 [Phaseolus vulgaris]
MRSGAKVRTVALSNLPLLLLLLLLRPCVSGNGNVRLVWKGKEAIREGEGVFGDCSFYFPLSTTQTQLHPSTNNTIPNFMTITTVALFNG